MRNKGHFFGVRTLTDSKNTLLGTCPEIQGTLNRCLLRKKERLNIYGVRIFRVNMVMYRMCLIKKEQMYHFFFGGGGGETPPPPERVY